MKSSVISGIQHLKLAQEHFEDFNRDNRGSKGAELFEGYNRRINWILKDVETFPHFTDVVREGIRREIKSDLLAIPSINQKVALLNPDQRVILEDVLDKLLTGGELIK